MAIGFFPAWRAALISARGAVSLGYNNTDDNLLVQPAQPSGRKIPGRACPAAAAGACPASRTGLLTAAFAAPEEAAPRLIAAKKARRKQAAERLPGTRAPPAG